MRKFRSIVAIAVLAVMAWTIPSAKADLSVNFVLTGADGSYDRATQTLSMGPSLEPMLFPRLTVSLVDPDIAPGVLDRASIIYDPLFSGSPLPAFSFNLNLDNSSGQWLAAGELFIASFSGSNAINAMFVSDQLVLTPKGAGYTLGITGWLSPMTPGGTILAGTNPWTFAGTPGLTGPDGIYGDGVANQVSMNDTTSYRSGDLVLVQMDLPAIAGTTPDELFSSQGTDWASYTAGAASISGEVMPVPGAAILGAVGLLATGLWMRRKV